MISGPSGAGKGTVIQGLVLRRPDVYLSVSYTTRPPRPTERHGVHYYFVGDAQFIAMRDRGELLEWAEVHGYKYGSPRAEIEAKLIAGTDVILEIDVQGALQVKRQMPSAFLIFIEAPSMAVLEERLRNRRTDEEDAMTRRLHNAYDEIRMRHMYDGVVVNVEVDTAVEALLGLMDQLKEKR